VRAAARAGRWAGTTRGAAPGYLQCNLVVLPADDAAAFDRWCALNPSVAPVVGRSSPGDPHMPALGDVDLRYDLPAYRVYERGVPTAEVDDLAALWAVDLVGFAFGCSFSLEDVLRRERVPLAYEHRGFGGPVIASMRPLPREAVAAAFRVSERYPQLHGRPVHAGNPSAIGVELDRPLETLGAVDVAADEVPVFWACGVTTQTAIERARPERAFTHVSSRMLVSDVRLDELATDAAGRPTVDPAASVDALRGLV